jgi:hypothetical protein
MKSMIDKIWISCPISVPQGKLDAFKAYLERHFPQVDTWDRESEYSGRGLDSSDAVAFMLPDNGFKHSIEHLPVGLKSELKRARDGKKKILIGYYRATSKEWAVYDAKFTREPVYSGAWGRTTMTYYIEGIEYSTKQVLMAAGKKGSDSSGSFTVNNPEMISIKTTFKADTFKVKGFDRRLLLIL